MQIIRMRAAILLQQQPRQRQRCRIIGPRRSSPLARPQATAPDVHRHCRPRARLRDRPPNLRNKGVISSQGGQQAGTSKYATHIHKPCTKQYTDNRQKNYTTGHHKNMTSTSIRERMQSTKKSNVSKDTKKNKNTTMQKIHDTKPKRVPQGLSPPQTMKPGVPVQKEAL